MSRLLNLARRAGIGLTPEQAERLSALAELLRHTNARVNLIARTDVENVEERHVLHCLALTRRAFPAGSTVVDWGTGGGLPLLPLAICNPAVSFVGVDAVEKKTLAVRAMTRTLGIGNVDAWHGRAETFRQPHTHSVSRATAPLATLWAWHIPSAIDGSSIEGQWPAGLVVLKGGDLAAERADLEQTAPGVRIEAQPVGLPGGYFAGKHVVTVTAPVASNGGDESTGHA